MKTKDFCEQTALVTGGATGIGRAFTGALLENGIGTVIIASRRQNVLDEAARELNSKFGENKVIPYAFDIRSRAETENLVRFALEKCGAVDVLINNSGLAVPESVTEITDAGWNTVLETNLRGAMWLVQMLFPKMLEQDFGDIINVSSQAGKNGYADVPSYCASKFGLLGFAESLRDDARKRGANVRVFNFCPGLVDVETPKEQQARAGFIHVRNMAKTLIYALSLDRSVILEDINIYSR
ncbi:MAG TPA: SDR family oxidoreductase [Pyrinomonadaceae bacterium]